MSDNSDDFKEKVKSAALLRDNKGIRECYGVSNSAKFIPKGFLCGIPNIDNLEESDGALCVISKIQLSPDSELYTAILIREQFTELLEMLGEMRRKGEAGDASFSSKNNNCAIFLWSDGKAYPYNKAKTSFNDAERVLEVLGNGIDPDRVYWAVYGKSSDENSTTIDVLKDIVGVSNFNKLEGIVSDDENPAPTDGIPDELDDIVEAFVVDSESVQLRLQIPAALSFISSLQSKNFLILTGLSGSGKTKIAQAFARWISPASPSPGPGESGAPAGSSPFFKLIPVGADWIGNENIIGYPDGLLPPKLGEDGDLKEAGIYVTKPALDLIRHAMDPDHRGQPHFLILDEMNLSHVERYFADILSMLESGDPIELYSDVRNESGQPYDTRNLAPLLSLPKNLFIIGTVNVDETTYMFSPKVLDRANVIEFRVTPEEMESFLEAPLSPRVNDLDGLGTRFSPSFVTASASEPKPLDGASKGRFDQELALFFHLLREHGAEFGFRVAHEASLYTRFFHQLGRGKVWDNGDWVEVDSMGRDWLDHALDGVVIQKLLPKLHGSKVKLGTLLKKLYTACAAPHGGDPRDAKAVSRMLNEGSGLQEPSKPVPGNARYPKSSEKIYRMWRHLNENGFTSFPEN